MKNIINVKVPYNLDLPYTLYVNGRHIGKGVLDEKGEYYTFSFPENSVMVLFYTFGKYGERGNFRRCFVVTGCNEKLGMEASRLPGVDRNICIIYECRGKRLDILKNLLEYFQYEGMDDVYYLEPLFWYYMTALVEYYHGRKWEIERLYKNYKEEMKNEKCKKTKNYLCSELSS